MENKPKSKNQILENIFRRAVRKELETFIPNIMNEMREIHFSGLNPQIDIREQLAHQIDPMQSYSPATVLLNSMKQQSEPFVNENISISGTPSTPQPKFNLNAIGQLMQKTQNSSDFREFIQNSPTTYED
jgi:hypothetical protein